MSQTDSTDKCRCVPCDGESSTSEYKAVFEVREGPKRGDSGSVNVVYCDDCGAVVSVFLSMLIIPKPCLDTDRNNTLREKQ